jgi:flavin-binding protein dodecin
MSVAKVIEIISSSKKSFEDAVVQGVAKAADSLHDITGAWVKEQSAKVVNGKVAEFRVNLKVTFVLKDTPDVAAKLATKAVKKVVKPKKK